LQCNTPLLQQILAKARFSSSWLVRLFNAGSFIHAKEHNSIQFAASILYEHRFRTIYIKNIQLLKTLLWKK